MHGCRSPTAAGVLPDQEPRDEVDREEIESLRQTVMSDWQTQDPPPESPRMGLQPRGTPRGLDGDGSWLRVHKPVKMQLQHLKIRSPDC